MRKKLTRALSAILCAAMVICSDGAYALASETENVQIVEDISGNEDIFQTDISTGEITVDNEETIEGEDVIGEDEEIYTDELGNSFLYSPSMTASYDYTVDSGVLTSLTLGGQPVSGNVVLAADKGITAIGENVFKDNTEITYVVVPAGVTKIDTGAFSGCTSLKGVSLPKGVTEIGDKAFYSCTSLTQIAMPKTLEYIGEYAFYHNSNLYLVYSDDTTYSSLRVIGAYAFEKCSSLKYFFSDSSVTFPVALEAIGEYAFKECSSLTSLPLSDNIISIGEGAFSKCSGVVSVNIPKNLDILPARVFEECTSLTITNLGSSHRINTVGERAFYNCCSLANIYLGTSIAIIENEAFYGCTNMVSAKIVKSDVVLQGEVFSDYSAINRTLYIYSYEGSVKTYTRGRAGLVFKNLDAETDTTLYGYNTQCISGEGTIVVSDSENKDVASLGGVVYGTEVFVTVTPKSGYVLVEGSLRVNGEVLKAKEGKYSFKMPKGGALVTAEFVHENDDKKINGTSVSVQFSNGDVDSINPNLVKLKVGETTRILLIDGADGSVIPTEKITFDYNDTDSAKVVSVTTKGIVKALTANAAGKIVATVKSKNGTDIKTTITVQVDASVVDTLALKVTSYDDTYIGVSNTDPIVLSVNTSDLSDSSLSVTVQATTYDSDDKNISTALSWSSSDSNVAKLNKTSTTATGMSNKITIPKDAAGEAVITVKATREDKTVITKKIVVKAYDYTPRIDNSTISVNLNKETAQGTIKILEAYDSEIVDDQIKTESQDFNVTYKATEGGYKIFNVAAAHSLAEKTYTDNLIIKVDTGISITTYYIPVNFVVKTTKPNIKVSIDSNTKMDLLYANDGVVVTPKVTGLGSDSIAQFSLEALSTKTDDKKFLDNFEIDSVTGKITKKQAVLLTDSNKKAVTTGYLVIKLNGYKDGTEIKKKITVPVKTTEISYVLDKTSGTINSIAEEQTVILTVKDKKTNKAIDLSDTTKGEFSVNVGANSFAGTSVAIKDGKLELKIPANVGSGTKNVNIVITNDAWANKTITLNYKIKASSSTPTVSLDKSSVTVNTLYPDKAATFKFKSNQSDTSFATDQTFVAKSTSKTKAQYDKLAVSFDPITQTGTVAILDTTVKTGTYKYTCNVKRVVNGSVLSTKTVTLSVVVSSAKPEASLSAKTVTLNQSAFDADNNYSDTTTVKISTKKLPAGYTLDTSETIKSIVCTTKNKADFVNSICAYESNGNLQFVLSQPVNNGTYTLKFTPAYTNESGTNTIYSNSKTVGVKVISNSVNVDLGKAKGKLNLIDRVDTVAAADTYVASKKLLFTEKNSIIYSPKVNYANDKISEVLVYDGNSQPSLGNDDSSKDTKESELFTATYLGGKIYITPVQGAALKNSTTYKLVLLVKFANNTSTGKAGGVLTKVISVKTGQTLPSVKADTTEYKLFLSNKKTSTTFTLKPGSGKIAAVSFDEKDTKALESFDIYTNDNPDGSMDVTITLKDNISYATNSVNKVKLNVKFENQATNSSGVTVERTIRINK